MVDVMRGGGGDDPNDNRNQPHKKLNFFQKQKQKRAKKKFDKEQVKLAQKRTQDADKRRERRAKGRAMLFTEQQAQGIQEIVNQRIEEQEGTQKALKESLPFFDDL